MTEIENNQNVKDKKFYWLKLKRDFFKRHDIQIIEDMPNGKDYILFYLKLLCESVDHEGHLRFSDEIPYDEQMLSSLTRTNVDIVRSAVKIFAQLKMLEIFDDGTYYLKEVQKMMGKETYWAERKRLQRQGENKEVGQFPIMSNESPTCPSKSKILDIDKDLDIDNKEKDNTVVLSKKKSDDIMELKNNSSFDRTSFDEFVARFNIQVDNYDGATMSQADFTALTRAYENSTNFLQRYDEHPFCQFLSWICKNYKSIVQGKYRDKVEPTKVGQDVFEDMAKVLEMRRRRKNGEDNG